MGKRPKPVKASSLNKRRKPLALSDGKKAKLQRRLSEICFLNAVADEMELSMFRQVERVLESFDLACTEFDHKPVPPKNRFAAIEEILQHSVPLANALDELDPNTISDIKNADMKEASFYLLRTLLHDLNGAAARVSSLLQTLSFQGAPTNMGPWAIADMLLVIFNQYNPADSPDHQRRGIDFVRQALRGIGKPLPEEALKQGVAFNDAWGGLRTIVRGKLPK